MRYVSTRGQARPCDFLEMLLAGTASDGGLFMPEFWPRFSSAEIAHLAHRPYTEVALEIVSRFVGDVFTREELAADIVAAYQTFDTPLVAPLVPLGRDYHLLELFHGPTLAFKDIALQLLGRLVSRALEKRGSKGTVVAATSGDTGAAAIAAFADMKNVEIFVLYPQGRVSEIQRRQMTTSTAGNVHVLAVAGTFDDAQAIVKGLFADEAFANRSGLISVNSINFARILAQSVYYFTTAAQLPLPAVFAVPTGNFGDVFAGEAAMRLGLSIERLLVATNANDTMVRILNEGVYAAGKSVATLSPAMDIQIASNFERALFEAANRDADIVRGLHSEGRNRRLHIAPPVLSNLQVRYAANRASNEETLGTIRRLFEETGRLIDPHTAVALAAARKYGGRDGVPLVALSTAHPAKFPEAIEAALGRKPSLPERLSVLRDRPEKVVPIEPNLPLVRAYIEARLAHHES